MIEDNITRFDPPSPVRDWVIRHFRFWPSFYWGGDTPYDLTRSHADFHVRAMYGVSIGLSFFGLMLLKECR